MHSVSDRATGLSRLSRNLSESVAVFEPSQTNPTADLQARFKSVLSGLDGRTVSADALFDVLRLEILDWGMDHQIETTAAQSSLDMPDPIKSDS